MKYLILSLFLSGCGDFNSYIYSSVQKECPSKCYTKNQVWTGYIKAFPDTLNCVCDGELK